VVSAGGPSGQTPNLLPHNSSDRFASPVVLGYLVAGRSPAERVEFLAKPPRAKSVTVGPRARVYRNYTRRLRGE